VLCKRRNKQQAYSNGQSAEKKYCLHCLNFASITLPGGLTLDWWMQINVVRRALLEITGGSKLSVQET
jgi:hypothetical protein